MKSLDDIKTIDIMGLGQMGYSLALDIRKNMPKVKITGYESNSDKIREIKKRDDYKQIFQGGEVYSYKDLYQTGFKLADLTILATPIEKNKRVF